MTNNDLINLIKKQYESHQDNEPYFPELENAEQIKRIADEFERLNDKIDMLENKVDAEMERAEKAEKRNIVLSFAFSVLLFLVQTALTLLIGFLRS